MGGFLERDFHVVTEIVAPLGLAWVGPAAAEEVFEDSTAAEDFPEDLKRIVEATGSITTCAAIEGGVAVRVVEGALLWVAHDFIRLAEFLELFLRRLVARVLIRMVLQR